MTTEQSPADVAREARRAREPIRAGDYFTLAGYEWLGTRLPWENPNPLYSAERSLADASICYRLGNRPEWSKQRCRLGILLAETTRERLSDAVESPLLELQEGACYEYVADLRLTADYGDATADLTAAINKYDEASSRTSSGEPFSLVDVEELNDYSIGLFNELVAVTTADIEPVDGWDSELPLADWVRYKRRHLPELIEHLLDTGIEAYADTS